MLVYQRVVPAYLETLFLFHCFTLSYLCMEVGSIEETHTHLKDMFFFSYGCYFKANAQASFGCPSLPVSRSVWDGWLNSSLNYG